MMPPSDKKMQHVESETAQKAIGEQQTPLIGEQKTQLPSQRQTSLISHRSHVVIEAPSFLMKWMQYANSNAYHRDTNPGGVINLGTAENKLCEDILVEKLSSSNVTEGYMNYYFTPYGTKSFRGALTTFLEDKFNACKKIDPENIVVAAGCGAVFDLLSFALAEEEDYFLSATPHYPRVKNNLGERGRVRIYEVPLTSELDGDDTAPFQLTARKLEAGYHRATKEGKKVRGLVLLNPNNPLGDAYTEKQLREILVFAARYKLHVICDEIYGLSTFDEKTKHTSILSLDNLPDPNRVYFMWGFSKDFALAGYRCGMVHTLNPSVLAYCKIMANCQSVPISIQTKLESLISDKEWTDRVYFPTNLQRIRANFSLCKSRLSALGIQLHPSKGGLFLWINVKKVLGNPPTFEAENELFEDLIAHGVYCVPGRSMRCVEPGWLRVVFTVTREEITEGLNRIEETILARIGKYQNDRATYSAEYVNVPSDNAAVKRFVPKTKPVENLQKPQTLYRSTGHRLQVKSSKIKPAQSLENLHQYNNDQLNSRVEPRESSFENSDDGPDVYKMINGYQSYIDAQRTNGKSSVFSALKKLFRPNVHNHKMGRPMGADISRMSRSEADLLRSS